MYSIHTDKKKVTFTRKAAIDYDKLVIATGSTPRKPPIKGIDGKGVFFLKSHKDQESIKKAAAESKGVALIGSGFIGSECASSLKAQYEDKLEIHLIGMEEQPL